MNTPFNDGNFSISLANSSDLDSLFEIEAKAHLVPWTRKMLYDSLSGPNICRKFSQSNELLGFFILLDGGDFGEILNIVISADYQGKGFGKILIQKLIEEANMREYERIFLEVRASNAIAQKLYRTAGFEQVGIRKNYYRTADGKEDGLVMELVLKNA